MTPLLERHFHVTLIELVTFHVAIVIACGEVHLVGVSSLDKGCGTDSSDVLVGEGDDALSGAAGKVGCGAFSMEVVSGPAEAAGAVVGALAAIMTQVFAMAREAVGERGLLALAKY
jgi:hypothetical protein